MPTDRLVTTARVLKAIRELERRGQPPVLSELEDLEPDLTEHLLESLSQMHRRLMDAGLSGRDARRAYRSAEEMALVCVLALRQGYRDLLANGAEGPEPDETGQPS